jgi:hypothetical protein
LLPLAQIDRVYGRRNIHRLRHRILRNFIEPQLMRAMLMYRVARL